MNIENENIEEIFEVPEHFCNTCQTPLTKAEELFPLFFDLSKFSSLSESQHIPLEVMGMTETLSFPLTVCKECFFRYSKNVLHSLNEEKEVIERKLLTLESEVREQTKKAFLKTENPLTIIKGIIVFKRLENFAQNRLALLSSLIAEIVSSN